MVMLPHRRKAFRAALVPPQKRYTAPTTGSDGDLLDTLVDSGTLAQNATASGAARPTLRVAAVNGRNAVEANGTSNVMAFTAFSTVGDWTVITFQRRQGALQAAVVGAGSIKPPYSALEYPSLNRIFVANRVAQNDAALPAQAWRVLTTRSAGGVLSLRVDGLSVALSNTYPDSGAYDFDRLFGRGGTFWAVRMADTLMFSSALDTSASRAWELQLGNLYGIAISP